MSLWLTTYPLLYAWRVGVPATTFPTSIGPFENAGSRVANRFILSRLTRIVARDQLSWAAADSIGLGSKTDTLPDGVFGMEPPTPERIQRACAQVDVEAGRFGVVVPRGTAQEFESDAFVGFVRQVCRAMLDSGAVDRLVVVPHAAEDYDFASFVAHDNGLDLIPSSTKDVDELVALYAGARVVVTERMHAAIFSLISGTPPITISIDGNKSEALYLSLRLPADLVIRRASLPAADVPHLVNLALQPELRNRFALSAAECRDQLKALPLLYSDMFAASK